MNSKKFITCIFLKNGKAVRDFKDRKLFADGDAVRLAQTYEQNGADALLIFDLSQKDEAHELNLKRIREISRSVHIPIAGGGHIDRGEDVKKLFYAGCSVVFLNMSKESNIVLLGEVSKRFGKEKLAVCINEFMNISENETYLRENASFAILFGDSRHVYEAVSRISLRAVPFFSESDQERLQALLNHKNVMGVSGPAISDLTTDISALRRAMKARGINVNSFEAAFAWQDFKLDSNGLLPVVVQDFDNHQVLMMAYMNQEAYEQTLLTGKMTYYSRSRKTLWQKGETSGHYQFLRHLCVDCDNDTLLARVVQVGAACHTGNRSCFYRDVAGIQAQQRNRASVFEDVMKVILDRKQNPKEGSYTTYLFERGIDKILKKLGEEATEIVIAAKNPEPEELKYEIGDFLYHMMVLMAQKGVSWDDITDELAKR